MTDVANLYDAVVIGGGPAGLTAAIYLGRARYRVLVIEKDRFGGQITITDNVVNYPGVMSASGSELAETMRRQAESFGAEFLKAEVTGLAMEGDIKTVSTTKGDIECFSVLLATGARPRHVGFEGEEEFQGHGVAYCATCDGEFFTGRSVFVVGGGLAAAEEALFLTRYASDVTILVRKDAFRAERSVVEQVEAHPDIDVLYNTRVVSVKGDNVLRSMVLEDTVTGEQVTYAALPGDTFGIFVFVGYEPATGLVEGIADLDDKGYVLTDEHQMTSCPGLYAAGDVCVKTLRQVTTAVGQAATTATEMERYIKDMQEATGLVPENPKANEPAPVASPAAEACPITAGSSDVAQGAAAPGTVFGFELPKRSDLFDNEQLADLDELFAFMEHGLVLKLALDERPVSATLESNVAELARLSEGRITVTPVDAAEAKDAPYVEICDAEGNSLGMRFHGVPGGHEFHSFVSALGFAAGYRKGYDDSDLASVEAIGEPLKFDLLVTLTCTNCPDVARAIQFMAASNPNVTTDIYDANAFQQMAMDWNVMGVPFLIVNDGEKTSVGRKGLPEILELVTE